MVSHKKQEQEGFAKRLAEKFVVNTFGEAPCQECADKAVAVFRRLVPAIDAIARLGLDHCDVADTLRFYVEELEGNHDD